MLTWRRKFSSVPSWPWPSDPCSLPHFLMNLMDQEIQLKSLSKIAAMLAGKIAGGWSNPAFTAQLGVRGDSLGAEIFNYAEKSAILNSQ